MTIVDTIYCDRLTPIQEFYSGTNIFLTGATGFFGKIILDKLFRLTPDISVYILIRPKKNKTVEERIEELFSDKVHNLTKHFNNTNIFLFQVFDLLKEEVPEFRKKIFPIIGDCSEHNLGINEDDIEKIVTNVQIVFHAAATVKFDEHIKTALKINVQGTKYLLDICKQCTRLKVITLYQ